MKKQTKYFIALLSFLSLTVGCIALGTKQTAQSQAAVTSQPADTIPPILSQKRVENGIDYIIDTTRCRLTPEQFIQRYAKWLGLDENNTLKINTNAFPGRKKDPKNIEQEYAYRHHFKGILVAGSGSYFKTYNNIVVYVGDWSKKVPDTIDITINFTPEEAQAMVAELVRKEGIADTVNTHQWAPDRKVTAADFVQKDSVIATINKAILSMNARTWQLEYYVNVQFSDDGDIIVDRTRAFWINPKTGKATSSINYYGAGSSRISYTCIKSCAESADIGGITANLAPESACDDPILPLYNDCDNIFNDQVSLTVPTIGNKASSCPPPPPVPELYDDVVTCRNINLTRQNTCNTDEYNYALYSTSIPDLHAYHYQAAIGTEANLYEGDHVKFPSNPDYIFKENVLAATSAYWHLDIAQAYFANKGIQSYDGLGSPIEVVVGKSDIQAQWTQYIKFPGELYPPAFVKQIYIENIESGPDFEYVKLNVLAHEYTHAVLTNYFQVIPGEYELLYPTTPPTPTELEKAEVSALHESIADIFAVLIMEKARQDGILCNNETEQTKRWWLKIDQLFSHRLDNPALTVNLYGIGQATYYNSDTYNSIVNNSLYSTYLSYYRAGIISYWFYLATEGSTTPVGGINDICGLGIETMTNVLFATLEKCKAANNNENYLPSFEAFCQKSIDAIDEMSLPEPDKCKIRKCVLKAWKAVGLGLTIPGGKTTDTQDETPCFVDLRMRDNNWDTGQEPNYSAGVDVDGGGWSATSPADWEDIWNSPDLWNCKEEECQPENWHNPIAVLPNKLGFTIYNAHPDIVSDEAKLHLYYTMASTGETWPGHWKGYYLDIIDYICYWGNEIAESPVTIPAINPKEYYTSWLSWSPPNFVNSGYAFYADPSACGLTTEIDPIDLLAKYEICLLARIESDADPMVGEQENVSVGDNVLNSNNIVTRNMFLIDPASGVGGGIPPALWGHPSVILMSNNNTKLKNLDLLFEKLSSGSVQDIANILEVSIVLSPKLWEKWESTGKKGEGVQIVGTREVKITNMATAKLLNLPFDAKEFQPIAIKVTILSNAGKNAPLANLPNDFTFRISHQSSDGSPINKPSNCLFKVEDLNQKIATAQAATQTSLNCYPNPFSNELQVSFYLEKQQAVSLFLYDLQGKLVKIIQSNKIFTEGMHTISVESVTLPKGMYICNLVTRTNQINQKVVLIK